MSTTGITLSSTNSRTSSTRRTRARTEFHNLGRTSRYITWARVVGREYQDLQRHVKAGMASLLDQYGATNEAEFFAVATECFFEKPHQMKAQYPELYEELKKFYRQDPANYL